MKEKIIFLKKFIANPLQNASLIPSSKKSSKAMLTGIDFTKVQTVVELGPGVGSFTEELLNRVQPSTNVILIEIDKDFIQILEKKYGDKVVIVNESAENLNQILSNRGIGKVDLIISSLPISLPKQIFNNVLQCIQDHTEKGAVFRYFTYVPSVMKKYYELLPIKKVSSVYRNFPPMYIYGIN